MDINMVCHDTTSHRLRRLEEYSLSGPLTEETNSSRHVLQKAALAHIWNIPASVK